MKMSEEMAVRLHRMMWSDMQRELGDCPNSYDRNKYKENWCETHFPGETISFNCFLCEYSNHNGFDNNCDKCPIRWPDGRCSSAIGRPPVKADYRVAPISEILALPAKNEKDVDKYVAHDEKMVLDAYYKCREFLLSKASGIPESSAIGDHVKAIQEKAVAEKAADVIDDFLYRCEKYPDTPINERLKKRLCAIKEKAIEEYFEKTPGAKLASMDVDDAFKQYAKEQTESYRKSCMLLVDTLNKYKDKLSEESGLNRDRPIDDHIREIVKNSMEAGATEERDRIQEKIYEVLLS